MYMDIAFFNPWWRDGVEVKIRSSLRREDFRGIVSFMRRYKVEKALMITSRDEGKWSKGGHNVQMIPYWKHWSIERYLKEQI